MLNDWLCSEYSFEWGLYDAPTPDAAPAEMPPQTDLALALMQAATAKQRELHALAQLAAMRAERDDLRSGQNAVCEALTECKVTGGNAVDRIYRMHAELVALREALGTAARSAATPVAVGG